MISVDKQLKTISGSLKSATLTVLFIGIITIAAELVPELKNWLKVTFTHHWIGKSILSLGLFMTASLLFSVSPGKMDVDKITSQLRILIIMTVVSSFAIIGFFIFEAFFTSLY